MRASLPARHLNPRASQVYEHVNQTYLRVLNQTYLRVQYTRTKSISWRPRWRNPPNVLPVAR